MVETKKNSVSETTRHSYRHFTTVTLRYGDTDRQGHVNNAVYCTLFESGRVAFMFFPDGGSIADEGNAFVIARLTLDFLEELNFPGDVEIASRVVSIGRSSFTVRQAIFKDGACCSTAESVIVHIDKSTKRSHPLSPGVLAVLDKIR